ncbi:MAG: GNAT family N-acetyltransferase [Candidatus Hodarchaeota archaeon]
MNHLGSYSTLTSEEMSLLAELLGDSPETILAVHALRRHDCQALVIGEFSAIQAAVIQRTEFPSEPQAFGTDVRAIWKLLQAIQGWDCVNVAWDVAESLGVLIHEKLRIPVRYYGDFYYTLPKPVAQFRHEHVRRLGLEDLDLLESAPKEFRGHGYGSPRGLLEAGLVACGIVSGRVVSIAHTAGQTKKFADIGVITHKDWQNKGLATAAASIVAKVLQEKGIIPVWSAGDDNPPSVRIAQKLGFSKVSQRQYVILEKKEGYTSG